LHMKSFEAICHISCAGIRLSPKKTASILSTTRVASTSHPILSEACSPTIRFWKMCRPIPRCTNSTVNCSIRCVPLMGNPWLPTSASSVVRVAVTAAGEHWRISSFNSHPITPSLRNIRHYSTISAPDAHGCRSG